MSMKRIVDYPRLYDSAKLAALPSEELRVEYCWLLGIVGPNGSYEWCPRRVWAAAYAPIRERTVSEVAAYLDALLKAGLLVKWEQDSKTWGYFTGSELPGRLPRESWRVRYAKSGKMAPPPPEHLVPKHAHSVSSSRQSREEVTEEACSEREAGVPLSDSLSESLSESLAEIDYTRGTRTTARSSANLNESPADSQFNSTEGAQFVCQELSLAGTEMRWLIQDGIDAKLQKSTLAVKDIAESMVAAWRRYSSRRKGMKFTKSVKSFFAEGLWDRPEAWVECASGLNVPLSIPQRSASEEMQRQLREG